MAPLPKPEVIITHESDLDGLLSGALLQRLAQKLFGTDIPLEAYHYNFWNSAICASGPPGCGLHF
jgi:hypothetical protein